MGRGRERRTVVRVVVDESGSMGAHQQETINAHKKYLDKLSETPADVRVSLDIFDSEARTVYENEYLSRAEPLDGKQANYDAMSGGGTSLYDAFGAAIDRQASLSPENDHIIMVVITDGYDTDSTKFNAASIKAKVEAKKATKRWDFIWLGPNKTAAVDVGITEDKIFELKSGGAGITAALAAAGELTERLLLSAGTPEV